MMQTIKYLSGYIHIGDSENDNTIRFNCNSYSEYFTAKSIDSAKRAIRKKFKNDCPKIDVYLDGKYQYSTLSLPYVYMVLQSERKEMERKNKTGKLIACIDHK